MNYIMGIVFSASIDYLIEYLTTFYHGQLQVGVKRREELSNPYPVRIIPVH